ncbi:hypothetical protein ACI6Q5_20690 [Xanthomonas codiaei]|uniref:Uncharacterized protein n=1 Tax=Xanthomonas codiaei TaxID=56463 RepID=A0A2S7C3D5_9XANT|nr:hypothetical protein [Xanthomonas codiaei]PPU56074.1 hypothetical protein XcodCFBP4690_21845 [Xanthomonas codiaei]
MQTLLKPVGSEIEWQVGPDVTEISNTSSGLRIVLAAQKSIDRYHEIHFLFVRAFQVMDEGDMLEYWQNPLTTGHVLYKVASGGWVSECLCVSVISAYVPHVREFGDTV